MTGSRVERHLLAELRATRRALTVEELARRVNCRAAHAQLVLQRLHEAGYVMPGDTRPTRWGITTSGYALPEGRT